MLTSQIVSFEDFSTRSLIHMTTIVSGNLFALGEDRQEVDASAADR